MARLQPFGWQAACTFHSASSTAHGSRLRPETLPSMLFKHRQYRTRAGVRARQGLLRRGGSSRRGRPRCVFARRSITRGRSRQATFRSRPLRFCNSPAGGCQCSWGCAGMPSRRLYEKSQSPTSTLQFSPSWSPYRRPVRPWRELSERIHRLSSFPGKAGSSPLPIVCRPLSRSINLPETATISRMARRFRPPPLGQTTVRLSTHWPEVG